MRQIKEIILHCSATPENRDIKAKDIREWHINENGWKDIGYHYIIDIDGTVENGRPVEQPGAHTKGHNENSIGICYIGGCDKNMKSKDTRTPEQMDALLDLVYVLCEQYHLTIENIHCHNEYSDKNCPSFTIDEFRQEFKAEFGKILLWTIQK